jgi:hypothetical protein
MESAGPPDEVEEAVVEVLEVARGALGEVGLVVGLALDPQAARAAAAANDTGMARYFRCLDAKGKSNTLNNFMRSS